MSKVDVSADYRLIIDGRTVQAPGTFPVLNPATGALLAEAPECSPEQLNEAVGAARRAFPLWQAHSPDDRAEKLRFIANRLTDAAEELAVLLTREQGKPLSDARFEITNSAKWFDYYAAARLPLTEHAEPDGRVATIRRVPLGVVGAIAPWNFPIQLAVWKIAPALMAGNTVVLKPSPYTPLSSLKLGELLLDLLPPGVLNVISGGDDLGPLVSGHPGIDKIAFTGSTPTGRAVMRSAAVNLKRLTLELGGNDPAIVLPDVDIDVVAERLFWAAFRNAGQVCVAAKRIYVHDDIYDRFAKKMAALARENAPLPGEDPACRIGPIQNRVQFDRVRTMIEDARKSGLRFLSEPGPMDGPGYFIAPTVVDNPPANSCVVTEEAFGPVVPLMRFTQVGDVVRRANESEYGLSASVWSADVSLAAAIGGRLEAGTVWLNTIHGLVPSLPFGGHKQSGLGVENALDGLLSYTNTQVLVR